MSTGDHGCLRSVHRCPRVAKGNQWRYIQNEEIQGSKAWKVKKSSKCQVVMLNMMNSGFYWGNPKRTKSIEISNLFFEYYHAIFDPKMAIIMLMFFFSADVLYVIQLFPFDFTRFKRHSVGAHLRLVRLQMIFAPSTCQQWIRIST